MGRFAPIDARTFWSRRAELYDRAYDGRTPDAHALRARLDMTIRLLGPGPGSLLDAGMGPGRLCVELEALGWTVSGVDSSDEMVAYARRRLPNAAARFIQADIETLPYTDGAFDAITATGVLEYANLARALGELSRVLRPGGVAVLSYPNPRAVYGILKSRAWYPSVRAAKSMLRKPAQFPRGGRPVPPSRFIETAMNAGLSVARIEYVSYLIMPTPLDLALPQLAARIGNRLEGRLPRFEPLLATQVVYAARKTS